MKSEGYLSTPAWRELATETVLGRFIRVFRERPRHVLDLVDLAPDAPGLDLFVQGGRRISFGGFRQAIEAAAARFADMGVRPGDKVLLVLYNSPEVLLVQWGLWRLGAIPVFGNRWWSGPELDEVIGRVAPVLVVTDLEAKGRRTVSPAQVADWWNLPLPERNAPDPRAVTSEDALTVIVFTAGSTGTPKGVQLSHRNIVWSQQTLHVMRGARPPVPRSPAEQKVTLMTTPMFHNGAIVTGISALIDGNRIVMLPGKFDPGEVLRLIEAERVTAWQAVPTMFSRVLQHPDFGSYDLSSLVAPSSGGTRVPAALVGALDTQLPAAAANFVVGYGMTEASFLTMAGRADMRGREGTAGRPIPGVEMTVADPDATGEGELLGRSGALMIGYLGTDEQPVDAHGWYHTGDRGRIDEDGYVYVTGRVKDMIIRGGENISCAHVEGALLEHPDVLEAAVIGYPDEQFGELVGAIVRVRSGEALGEASLAAFARTKLAYFSVPTRLILTELPLPVLATGKIDKVSLAAQLRSASGAAA